MNTAVTSRQALLAASRAVARRQGLDGLSIRAVAAEAEVSVGSVYNYFSGKAELMAATVEEIWGQILSAPEAEPPEDFVSCVHGLFRRIRTGAGEYPGFSGDTPPASCRRGGPAAARPWRRPWGSSAGCCCGRWRRIGPYRPPPLTIVSPGSSWPPLCWTACWDS